MNTLDDWIAAACAELGLDPGSVARDPVLDLAREVAHGVARPAAPLSTYLAGVAVGRGADPNRVTATLAGLARSWPGREPGREPAAPAG